MVILRRTKSAGNEVITAWRLELFLVGEGFREFGSDKRYISRFHALIHLWITKFISKNKNTQPVSISKNNTVLNCKLVYLASVYHLSIFNFIQQKCSR